MAIDSVNFYSHMRTSKVEICSYCPISNGQRFVVQVNLCSEMGTGILKPRIWLLLRSGRQEVEELLFWAITSLLIFFFKLFFSSQAT